jgi:hypothetical protein
MLIGVFSLYLSLYQLLYIFNSPDTFLSRYVIDIFFGTLRYGFAEHLLALPHCGIARFTAHRQLGEIGTRGPQLNTCNAVSTVALDMYRIQSG